MSDSEVLMDMTLAIDALSAVSGGGLSVSKGLIQSLGNIRPGWRILVLATGEQALPDSLPPNIELLEFDVAIRPMRRWAIEQLVLPGRLAREDVGIILLLGGFRIFGSRIPQVSVWQNAHVWSPATSTQSMRLRTYIAAQRIVMRATVPRVASNIFLSRDSANRCQSSFGLSMSRVETAPIGLDERFTHQTSVPDRDQRAPFILCVGDIYEHKRFELAIDALAHLDFKHRHLELWIAGRNLDQRCRDQLDAQVERSGLQNRVRFLGHVDSSRLVDLYRTASLFVTSTRLETFGLTPIEAMACGLPVVACPESAVPEVCGEAARYAEPTGPAIAAAIHLLLTNSVEWNATRDRGLERSRAFAWPLVAERYASILEGVLEGSSE
jgi:glycosyltransferase involved in cell wall biosynthesis